MKGNKKRVIILLIIVSMITIFFAFKTSINKPLKNLPEVKLREIKKDKAIAIMVSTDGEKYKKYEGEEWPGIGYKYKEAKCVNNSGKEIKEAITYEKTSNTVTLESNETLYCTLYFDVIRKITLLADNINIVGKDATLTNLVSNGSFEGSTTNWNIPAGILLTNEKAKFGQYSLKNYKTPPYYAAGNTVNNIVANHNFYLSGWLYSTGNIWCYHDFGFIYDNVVHYENLGGITTNNVWVRVSKLTTSPNYNNLQAGFAVTDNGNDATSDAVCYGDGVMMIDLSESYNQEIPSKSYLDTNVGKFYFEDKADIKTVTGITGEFEASAKTGKIECDGGEGTIENGKVTITGNADEISCVIRNNPISTLRENDKNNNLSQELVGGLYRYQGTYDKVDNNYICLGTDCSEYGNDMYRIIGISKDGNLKVIKKTALPTAYQWTSGGDVKWPNSDLYKNLNTNSNSIYNTLNSNLKSKIINTRWMYGDNTTEDYGENKMYLIETGQALASYYMKNSDSYLSTLQTYYWDIYNDAVSAPIGLMYLHDYLYAYSKTGAKNNTEAANSWIHLIHNELTHPSNCTYDGYECTMTRYGYTTGDASWGGYRTMFINPNGRFWSEWVNLYYAVRPVFSLTNNIELNGEGTIDHPFVIK